MPAKDSTDTMKIPCGYEALGVQSPGGEWMSRLSVKPQDRYRFLRSIGFGGMKGVLLVYDRETDREMAMAIMPDFLERPKCDLERFVREAFLTARLEHPNIVPVHDIGLDKNGSPYFTMKYLRGMPLSTLLHRLAQGDPETVAAYPLERLLQIFLRVCNAVSFAHSQRVCHLDLKPGNVNIGEFGEVLVLDWGLARQLDENGNAITEECDVSQGTPGYLAPEQFDPSSGIRPGVRSDVYALGALLYSILALEPPFSKLPQPEVLRRTLAGELPAPSQVAKHHFPVPGALEAVALKALAPAPEARYQSVHQLREEIRAYNSGFAPKAENANVLRQIGLFIRRNVLWVVTVLLVIALALLTLALLG